MLQQASMMHSHHTRSDDGNITPLQLEFERLVNTQSLSRRLQDWGGGGIQEPVFSNRNIQAHYKQQGNIKQADRLAVKTEREIEERKQNTTTSNITR